VKIGDGKGCSAVGDVFPQLTVEYDRHKFYAPLATV